MSDLISREQTLKYAKEKVDALIIEFNTRKHAHAEGFTIDAVKLLIKKIIQGAPDAEQWEYIDDTKRMCKNCRMTYVSYNGWKEEKNDNRRLRGKGNMEPFEEKEEEKG